MVRGLLRLALLAAVVLIPMRSLEAAGWVDGLDRAVYLAAAGLLLGAAITAMRPYDWPAVQAFGLVLGVVAVAVAYGPVAMDGSLSEQWAALYERLTSWWESASEGRASSDTLILALTLGLLGWTLGLVGATSVMGAHNAWWVIVPSATVLLVNISVGRPGLVVYLLPFAPAAVALIGQVQLERWRHHWQSAELPVARGVLGRATLATLVLSFLLVGVAWALPSSGERESRERTWPGMPAPLAGPLESVQSSMERWFSPESNPEPVPGAVEFSSSMEPQASAELGERVVFQVESPRKGYWRANTYDVYTGRAMQSTPSTEQALPAASEWRLDEAATNSATTVEQRFLVLAAESGITLGMESPVQVSVDTRWHYRQTPQDLHAILFSSPLQRGQSYSILSRVPTPTTQQLRAAPSDYPEWVRRFLQLPSGLPDRVGAESARIAGSALTNFDRALAIEAHLRTVTYSLQVPVPPEGQDWVDFVLFDSRQGYCDYLSTAMTVMLRSLGIPARVASGFASGEHDPLRGLYTVREDDAHSWVEAYFPGHGWIVFEPSAIRDLPDRRSEPEVAGLPPQRPPLAPDEPRPENAADQAEPTLPESALSAIAPLALLVARIVLAALVVCLAVTGAVLFLWRRGLAGLPAHERPYAELRRLFDWLGPRIAPSLTPLEFAAWAAALVPDARATISDAAAAYAAGRYGGARVTSQHPALADAWPAARYAVLRALVLRRAHTLGLLLGRRTGRRWAILDTLRSLP